MDGGWVALKWVSEGIIESRISIVYFPRARQTVDANSPLRTFYLMVLCQQIMLTGAVDSSLVDRAH